MGYLRKKAGTATVIMALGAGTAAGIYAYQKDVGFTPSGDVQKLHANKVDFSQDDDVKSKKSQENGSDKDKSALLDENALANTDAAYLFSQAQLELPQNEDDLLDQSVIINSNAAADTDKSDNVANAQNTGNTASNIIGNNSTDNVYNVTGDKSTADIIISNGDKPGGLIIPGNGTGNEAGSDDNKPENDNGNRNDHNGSSKDNVTDKDDKDDSNKGDNKGDNNGGGQTPVVYPSDKVTNPPPKKEKPDIYDNIVSDSFKEDEIASKKNLKVVINANLSWTNSLYKGQSVTQYDILCALDTYVAVMNTTTDNPYPDKLYTWSENDLDKYIRFTGISFDDGKTWDTEFPVEIPKDVQNDSAIIRAEYRLSTSDEWTEKRVDYILHDSRVFVLSKELTDNDEQINDENILNPGNQFYDTDSRIMLYQYQNQLLGESGEQLDALFPGWMERGEPADWNYEVSAGRHILEPAEMVKLDSRYKAKLQNYWLNDDEKVVPVEDMSGKYYCALQTLTEIQPEGMALAQNTDSLISAVGDFVAVPEYIQAVDLEEKTTIGILSIPDTVIYVNDAADGLRVNDAYVVSENNKNYSSFDGVLCNKEGTDMLGIPYNKTELDIPAQIKKVNITSDNRISRITLEADSMDEMPEIDYSNLSGCQVVVKDELLEEFIRTNESRIESGNNKVTSEKDNKTTYSVVNGMIISDTGELHGIAKARGTSVIIPEGIHSIGADAFKQSTVKTMILTAETDQDIVLMDNCFADSSISTIICVSEKQKENIESQISRSGRKNINVVIGKMSADGYLYYTDADGCTVLLSAPKDAVEFDGVLKLNEAGTETITVGRIGDYAFKGCDSIKWVELPESVSEIGYEAFYDCESLEGVLISNREHITIGNNAFEKDDSLRFVASNAKEATMVDDYDPVITDSHMLWERKDYYFYVPDDAEGYGSKANHLNGFSGVEGYSILNLGTEGRLLCAQDDNGTSWIAVRSGRNVPQKVELPSDIMYIYNFAFTDTVSASTDGKYELNWDDLYMLQGVGMGAFIDSHISGTIRLGAEDGFGFVSIGDGCMKDCRYITAVDIQAPLSYLGESSFSGCKNLEQVHIADTSFFKCGIYAGVFDGCDNLENIILDDYEAPELVIYGNMPFSFNSEWTQEEEESKLHITVPDGAEQNYIKAWRYGFAGHSGGYTGSKYIDMWNSTQTDMIDWVNYIFPDDEDVDKKVKEDILTNENHLRLMLGMDKVSEPTDFYPYRVDENGFITLVGVPSYVTDITLDGETLGMPDMWFADFIGTGAFSGASKLQKVTIPDNISAMRTNAFAGAAADSEKVTIVFESETPIDLLGYSPEVPFLFGLTDDKIRIEVPKGCEEAYVDIWKYPMAGYKDELDLRWAITDEVWSEIADDQDFDLDKVDEMINTRMNEILIPAENRLRAMMGLEPVNISDESDSDGSEQTEIDSNLTENDQEDSIKTDDMNIEDTEEDTEGDTE